MDFSVFSMAVQNAFGTQSPNILGAVGLLVVGYLLAVLARAAARMLLPLAKVNAFIGQSVGKPMDVERGVSLAAFWFVLLATLIGVSIPSIWNGFPASQRR